VCYLKVLELVGGEKKNHIQKFCYLEDNTKCDKTTKDESFIPIRSRENEE